MAFEVNAEEELDYENEDVLDTGLPGHPVLHGLNEEELDDEDYDVLYGDVNVGVYSGHLSDQAISTYRNATQNGDTSYGVMDPGNENYGGSDGPKVESVEIRDVGVNCLRPDMLSSMRPQEGSAEYHHEYIPHRKEESIYGDPEAGPSFLKPKDEFDQGLALGVRLPSCPKGVKGLHGTGGADGGAGRGFYPEGWPAGSGPAGGQADIAPAVANNNSVGDFPVKHTGQGPDVGGLMLFVGELQWWTTDAELEASLSDYGRIKNLKFFEEKASGKSKGYCQVEFFDSQAARVCKEKMDGRMFNGRACVVAFASPQTIKQMGAAQVGKNQANPLGQGQVGLGKKSADGRNTGAAGQGCEGRGFNKGGRGQPGMERGRGNQTPGRGRGRGMAPFGPQGSMGGPPGGMMPPRGMMGQVFEPGFGPPGSSYGMGPGGGGFGPRGPVFGPPFPPMGPGLPGVPAHVNPAFFGRGNGAGPGMGPGMQGPPGGWGEVGMPGWEEHQRQMREGGYVGPEDMGVAEFGYGGELGRVVPARDRERGVGEGEWVPDRRRREERNGERGEEWERGRCIGLVRGRDIASSGEKELSERRIRNGKELRD